MIKKLGGLLAAIAALVLVVGIAGAADDEKTPTIKEVMAKLNKKDAGLVPQVKSGLAGETPDWEKIQGQAKEIAKYAGYLGKNDPPKGEKADWQKATKKYTNAAKKLAKSAEDKNLEDARKYAGSMAGACKNCHPAHKP